MVGVARMKVKTAKWRGQNQGVNSSVDSGAMECGGGPRRGESARKTVRWAVGVLRSWRLGSQASSRSCEPQTFICPVANQPQHPRTAPCTRPPAHPGLRITP